MTTSSIHQQSASPFLFVYMSFIYTSNSTCSFLCFATISVTLSFYVLCYFEGTVVMQLSLVVHAVAFFLTLERAPPVPAHDEPDISVATLLMALILRRHGGDLPNLWMCLGCLRGSACLMRLTPVEKIVHIAGWSRALTNAQGQPHKLGPPLAVHNRA